MATVISRVSRPTSSTAAEVSTSLVAGRSRAGHPLGMQPEIWSPRHEDLVADLKVVREKGLGRLRSYATPALAVACRLYSALSDDARRPAAVEALLQDAVKKVGGGRSGEAASYTFGLVQGTRMWNATERRKGAAKAQGVSAERFRKGYEGVLIGQVAEGILSLLYERRLPSSAVDETPPLERDDAEARKKLFAHHNLGRTVTDRTTAEHYLALKLHEAGIVDFHLSRSDYRATLAQFLEQAQSSIMMVSMSLKTKGAENEILQVFRRSLARSSRFQVIISLVKPDSPACHAACVILGLPYTSFCAEVKSMPDDLGKLRSSLPVDQASRLYITQHTIIPSFSGILIDDGLPSAQLQTETKLYGAPRSDSFGFKLVSGTPFYERQRLAYYRIIQDAEPFPSGTKKPVLPPEL